MDIEINNVEELNPVGKRDFKILWESIEQVYQGQLNCCSCGCAGHYFYTQHYCDYRLEFDGNNLLTSSDEKIINLLEKVKESKSIGWYRDDTTPYAYILEVETETYGIGRNEIKEGIRICFKASPFKINKNR